MTTLHSSAFDYLQPTTEQLAAMTDARVAAHVYARALETLVPDGPDKTYLMRKLREVAMWANVAITRQADGSPRPPVEVDVRDYPADHPVKGDLGSVPL